MDFLTSSSLASQPGSSLPLRPRTGPGRGEQPRASLARVACGDWASTTRCWSGPAGDRSGGVASFGFRTDGSGGVNDSPASDAGRRERSRVAASRSHHTVTTTNGDSCRENALTRARPCELSAVMTRLPTAENGRECPQLPPGSHASRGSAPRPAAVIAGTSPGSVARRHGLGTGPAITSWRPGRAQRLTGPDTDGGGAETRPGADPTSGSPGRRAARPSNITVRLRPMGGQHSDSTPAAVG